MPRSLHDFRKLVLPGDGAEEREGRQFDLELLIKPLDRSGVDMDELYGILEEAVTAKRHERDYREQLARDADLRNQVSNAQNNAIAALRRLHGAYRAVLKQIFKGRTLRSDVPSEKDRFTPPKADEVLDWIETLQADEAVRVGGASLPPGRLTSIWRLNAERKLKRVGINRATIRGLFDAVGLTSRKRTPARKK